MRLKVESAKGGTVTGINPDHNVRKHDKGCKCRDTNSRSIDNIQLHATAYTQGLLGLSYSITSFLDSIPTETVLSCYKRNKKEQGESIRIR